MQRAWQRLAFLYLKEELDLAEIVKSSMIFSSAGFFGDTRDIQSIGINVLDNTELNSALVYGILYELQYHDVEKISYPKIGTMLTMHSQTVGKAVNRLIEETAILREDFGGAGSSYAIVDKRAYPQWIFQFTKALVALWLDEKLKEEITKETEHIEFRRGMQVLKRELREKFYRPSKKN